MHKDVVRFNASRRTDFFKLHSDANDHGWCFCVAWWVSTWEGWGERTTEQNKQLRESLCDRGEYDGYLLYVDGVPVGWCQVGPRDRLEKLTRQYQLASDQSAWAVTCFFIAPSHRRQRWAAYLLQEVLQDLRARGVKRLEAFPKRGANEAGELWNGPERMFLEAGFQLVKDDARRPVLALELQTRGE
jgi:GNAT superfamily N-acetyltransferase